jgi:transcriptional regulator of acetoin/glycerol metabolism
VIDFDRPTLARDLVSRENTVTQAAIHHTALVLDAIRSRVEAARSTVAASWCRSMLHHGLNPETEPRPERMGGRQLADLRAQHDLLLAVASPVLDQVFRSVGRSGCGVVLTDARGVILERRVTDGDVQTFAAAGVVEGGRWGEAEEGTNGIGTCLAEDRPVVIHRDQHFASRNIGISCMDAPVHDANGRLVAALDVSSCRDDHNLAAAEMIIALVRDAARRIERDLFCREFDGRRIIFLSDNDQAGTELLAADHDGMVIGASRAARLRFGLGDRRVEARPIEEFLGESELPSFAESERSVVRKALAVAGGNASEAARSLGIGRATLYRRMARTGLKR